MAPQGMALLAIGATLFAAARAVRPEQAGFSFSTSNSQGSELVAVEGRGSMAEHCKPFPGKRVVLVTVSMDYFDMFTNWMRSAKGFLQATEHLLVIAEEDAVVEPIETFLQGQEELDYSVASPKKPFSVLQLRPPYLSEEYGSVVWKRPDHLLNLLRADCSVLYVDIDTVWAKDPFHQIEAAGSADLYITDDAPGNVVPNLCTCFLYFHPVDTAKDLLQTWSAAATGHANQQIFNTVLQGATEAGTAPTVHVLPVAEFPPGALVAHAGAAELNKEAPPHPTVYHANWRIGQGEKVHFFDMLRMWDPASKHTSN